MAQQIQEAAAINMQTSALSGDKLANTIIPGIPNGVSKEKNFDAAFKKARKALGPGMVFMYKLEGEPNFKNYTTDFAQPDSVEDKKSFREFQPEGLLKGTFFDFVPDPAQVSDFLKDRFGREDMQEGGDVSMLPNVAPAPMMAGTPMGGDLSAQMAPAQAELDPAEMQEAQGALMQIIQIIQMLINQGMSEEEIQQFLAQYGITEEELDQAAAILGVDIDALIAGEQRMPMAEGGETEIIKVTATQGYPYGNPDTVTPESKQILLERKAEISNILSGGATYLGNKVFDPYDKRGGLIELDRDLIKKLNEELRAIDMELAGQFNQGMSRNERTANQIMRDTLLRIRNKKAEGGMPDPLAPAPVPRTPDMMIFSINSDINNLMQEYNMAVRNNEFERAQAIADQIDGLQQQIINLQESKVPPMPVPVAGLNMRFGGSAAGK